MTADAIEPLRLFCDGRPGRTSGRRHALEDDDVHPAGEHVWGSAPLTGCDLPTDIGNKAFQPYTADYVPRARPFYQLPANTSIATGRE